MTSRKFSVLLPTRDRLDLAKEAIETVRRQSFAGWELIVADNCSRDNVAEYIASLRDRRIVCIRSDTPIPVTENWNRAMNASSGDYVVMLGDDDGLVPGYFERLLKAIDKLKNPDFIYHGAYHFAFPGVLPGMPVGGLTDVTRFYDVLRSEEKVRLLPCEEGQTLAKAALDMRAYYAFNMQHFLFSRQFLARVSKFGLFFQGPFPDFYAANISMLMAERIGLLAEPMVIIGISPKSYGYHHFNNNEKEGAYLLNAAVGVDQTTHELMKQLLPGTNMNSFWLVSVALIAKQLTSRNDLQPNVARYRRLQIKHNLKKAALGEFSEASLRELWPRLTGKEKFFAIVLKAFLVPSAVLQGWLRVKWVGFADIFLAQYPPRRTDGPKPVVGHHQSIMGVFEDLADAVAPHARNAKVPAAQVMSQ